MPGSGRTVEITEFKSKHEHSFALSLCAHPTQRGGWNPQQESARESGAAEIPIPSGCRRLGLRTPSRCLDLQTQCKHLCHSNGVLQNGGTQAMSHKAPIKLNSEHSNMQSWVQRQCWQSHPERRAAGGHSVNRVKVSPSS